MMETPDRGRGSALVIGLTGGIATGKSTVAEELARQGAIVMSADAVAREITEPGGTALQSIVETFGPSVLNERGELDRSSMARRIFTYPEDRKQLEAIIHPIVLDRLRERIEKFRALPPNNPPVAVVEIPLLYEVGAEGLVDGVLVAAVELEIQIARLTRRTSWSESQAKAAIESQVPLSDKIARADWIIRTDGSLEDTRAATRAFWSQITHTFKEDSPCS